MIIKPLLEDHAPNVFGGYDLRAAGSLECNLSNRFNAVAVCAISDNEGTKSGLYPFFMPRRP